MAWNSFIIILALIGLFDLPEHADIVICAIFIWDIIQRFIYADNPYKLFKSPMLYIDIISVIPCFAPVKTARIIKFLKLRKAKPFPHLIAKTIKYASKIC